MSVILGVEADRLYGCHYNHHAKGHGNEQHDDVLGPVFQGHLLILVLLSLHHTWGTSGGRLSVLLWPSTIAATSATSAASSFTTPTISS